MANYYKTGRYPESAIEGFARSQRTLAQAPRLHIIALMKQEVPGRAITHELVHINLLYRFIDDEQEPPALAFRSLEPKEGEYEHMYALVYLDPSLLGLWVDEMNRERGEEE